MKQQNSRGQFTSNFGVMMAVAGSAVGLGNIWRFPYLAGMNGGAAFLILYLALILLVGIPLMLSEFSIGRATHRAAVGAFKQLAPKKKWYWIGYLAIVAGFAILGFYSVIAGWTIKFLVDAVQNNFAGQSSVQIDQAFNSFVNSGWQPILYTAIFIFMSTWIVMRGVEKGIEKFNKILMPMLVLILLTLCVNSMTLSGFSEGMNFLFNPDFSKITMQTVWDAMGQVFFTLSLGMGVMITYSSYVVKEDNMVRSKGIVTLIDASIAIVSGIAIFPAVFTYGLEPAQGPSLVFITLPNIFAQMPSGGIIGSLFFVLLFIAALTSVVSIMEMITAFFIEEYKVSRRKSLIYISIGVFVLSVFSALSQVQGSSLTVFGVNIFDALDKLSSNYFMTIGAFSTAIFTGWIFQKERLRKVFTSNGKYGAWIFPVFLFAIRFICPVAVAIIFLSQLGFI